MKIYRKLSSSRAKITVFDFQKDIMDPKRDLRREIEESYGPKGMGICLVSNIPDFVQKRSQLLWQAELLGQLPKERRARLERPDVHYQVGWSCGVEQFQGKPDFSKGSFYANPVLDNIAQEVLEQEKAQGISTKAHNIWPSQDLPEFEGLFKGLGSMVHSVGQELCRHLDYYVESNSQAYERGKLQRITGNKSGVVGRLLHYFPQT